MLSSSDDGQMTPHNFPPEVYRQARQMFYSCCSALAAVGNNQDVVQLSREQRLQGAEATDDGEDEELSFMRTDLVRMLNVPGSPFEQRSLAELEAIFDSLDANKDGQLTLGEFTEGFGHD
ncbi:unnamed protein product [Protopolystoma xenopodis]|uniref:EF-hand domain-containing protein n=1 Tax=Protopolystoma xenopodis TaxID=117903 RepID=A0A3S5CCG7_9PLAT|nr:unnamed protein product [Protopolystoma xenopodis]